MADVDRLQAALTADSLTMYLAEIGRAPLLSPAEEVDLAKAIEAGNEAAAALHSTSDSKERRRLRQAVAAGRRARNRFLESNLRLVVSVAKRYRSALRGIEMLDLIQEGNLGLVKAVERFDWRRGLRFSTYATWWIRQAMQHALVEKDRTIRVPLRLHDAAVTLRSIRAQFQASSGRLPTLHELAELSGIDVERVQDALNVTDVLSLEAPRGEDGSVVADFVELDDDGGPEAAAVNTMVSVDLRNAIDRLDERERLILLRRYGFHDGVPWARGEIGAILGVTAERVYQIERVALCRLRHPAFGLDERDLL